MPLSSVLSPLLRRGERKNALPPVEEKRGGVCRTTLCNTRGSRPLLHLPKYLFSVVATRATERGVYAASAWHKPGDVAESSSARKLRTTMRP